MAERAGIARPLDIDEIPIPGTSRMRASLTFSTAPLGFARYELGLGQLDLFHKDGKLDTNVRGMNARYIGAAANTIAPLGLILNAH